jgi:hypothetical protein
MPKWQWIVIRIFIGKGESMKRYGYVIFTFSIVFIMSSGAFASVIFQDDFSGGSVGWKSGSDMGWYANSDVSYYRVDSQTQNLVVNQPNTNVDGNAHVYFHPVNYSGGSFHLGFDFCPTYEGFDSAGKFGITSNAQNSVDSEERFFLGFGNPHWDVFMQAKNAQGESVTAMTSGVLSETEFLNKWWHCDLIYNDVTKNVIGSVIEKANPSHSILELNGILPNGFGHSLDFLTFGDPSIRTTSTSEYTIALYDNVILVPEPTTIFLLGLGGMVARKWGK